LNVRLTIDVPVRFLTGLEAALSARNLVIRPYLKGGAQRWELAARKGTDREPALPETIVGDSGFEEYEARAGMSALDRALAGEPA
jgi:hypothetical protein